MRNPFKPFTGESLLVALGLTLITSLVLPIIKELVTSDEKREKGMFNLDEKNEEHFLIDKSELNS
ncbi:hypothetical protein [Caldisalinibacter kiritimatiensis]|uniref:Uncharacterized protein n=1 Tax=Caldisalinibacter kiritimatiensis TaxID=1304284 RepID=R1CB41_9FIRM|nr:hypothetical protein [Caldisalinibacter kiritimatiensis]EOC99514.1 hypothetical protein L21TH_2426 [Caldisalinibacter kiritimatiensis]